MHYPPIPFVYEMVESGRKDEVIQMLDEFMHAIKERTARNDMLVYNFAGLFLFWVACQLKEVSSVKEMDEDHFIYVWKCLDMFGIDKTKIEDVLKKE